MAKKALPSPEVLRQLLRYEPETGKLFWKERGSEHFKSAFSMGMWNARYAGKPALTAISRGYPSGSIFDVNARAHRVAWAVYYGSWPKGELDHINGDRLDYRLCNLRDVTPSENRKNQRVRKNRVNLGVSWAKREGMWRARIFVDGEDKHLGYFRSLDDAVAARHTASVRFGFHENHGA